MTRIFILGTDTLAHDLLREVLARPDCRYTVVGVICEDHSAHMSASGWPVLGVYAELQRLICIYEPDEILVALREPCTCYPMHYLVDAQVRCGIRVESAHKFYERLTGKLALEALTPSDVQFMCEFRPERSSLWLGRLLSLGFALTGLMVLAPWMALIALLVKMDSRGPALFTHERCGLNGKSFKLLKFRSMRTDMPAVSEWESDNNARITRVGRWLRKFRLDELPQLINILKGDMNLVGPRPHPVTNRDLIALVARNMPGRGEPLPFYSLRMGVRPGITGWAQVRYKYANNVNEEIEKLRYDLYYIKHYSLPLDLRILLQTVLVVLAGHRGSGGIRSHWKFRNGSAGRVTRPAAGLGGGKTVVRPEPLQPVGRVVAGYAVHPNSEFELVDSGARRVS